MSKALYMCMAQSFSELSKVLILLLPFMGTLQQFACCFSLSTACSNWSSKQLPLSIFFLCALKIGKIYFDHVSSLPQFFPDPPNLPTHPILFLKYSEKKTLKQSSSESFQIRQAVEVIIPRTGEIDWKKSFFFLKWLQKIVVFTCSRIMQLVYKVTADHFFKSVGTHTKIKCHKVHCCFKY